LLKTAQRWFYVDEFGKSTLFWAFFLLFVRRMILSRYDLYVLYVCLMAAEIDKAQCLPCFITNGTIGYRIGNNNVIKIIKEA
jgi:hypothetical protein